MAPTSRQPLGVRAGHSVAAAAPAAREPPPSDDARSAHDARVLAALERNVRELTTRFAEDLVGLLRGALAPDSAPASPPRTKKRVRRRAATLRRLADAILAFLTKRSDVAISEIAAAIGATPREAVRPLAALLAQGSVEKTGERKGTRYALASRRAAAASPRPPRTRTRQAAAKSRGNKPSRHAAIVRRKRRRRG